MASSTVKRRQANKGDSESEASRVDFWSNAPTSGDDDNKPRAKNDEILGVPASQSRVVPSHLPPPKRKWGDFFIRLFGGMALSVACILVIRAGHVCTCSLIAMAQSLLFKEVVALRKDPEKEARLPSTPIVRWWFFAVLMVFGHGRALRPQLANLAADLGYPDAMQAHEFVCFCVYMLGIVFFVLSLRKGFFRYQFGMFAWVHMTLLLTILQTTWISANIFHGLIWFALPACLVICNDTSAYMFGRAFGRTQLISLSPKKTWEGFLGATLATVVLAFFLADFLSTSQHLICPKETLDFSAVHCNPPPEFVHTTYTLPRRLAALLPFDHLVLRPMQLHAVSLALFASSIGPFGGFFASGIKRALKKKDFGDIIPGHGGLADRFDCHILMAGFTFFYLRSFVHPVPVSVPALLHAIHALPIDKQLELRDLLASHLNALGY